MASSLGTRLYKLERSIPAPREEPRIVISLSDDDLKIEDFVSIPVTPAPALPKFLFRG